MLFAKRRHFITADGSDCGYQRTVLSLGQSLTILFMFTIVLSGYIMSHARVATNISDKITRGDVFQPKFGDVLLELSR